MPLIAQESVREVMDAVDLAELLRSRTTLTKRGGRWVGRCPFHEERTPSFGIIPPDNRYYYCHGCGAKGSAIDWMMAKEGAATYPDALEALAERFGVTLRYDETTPEDEARRRRDARRLELLARAAAFYREYLWKAPEAAVARDYLERRGFDEALVRSFDIGFAPSSGDGLAQRAAAQGFRPEEMMEAGLGRERRGRLADFFVNRITFPIADARGRVMGFGARTLDPAQRAKYVNSPEGPRFQKRRLLHGLHLARAQAAKAGVVVVVEGYTDVLAFAKAGVTNVVACMGTSLTIDQVREMKRVAERIALCFDADAAGQKAAWRSAEAAAEHIMSLDAIAVPGGGDPGDLARSPEGAATLISSYENRRPLVGSLIEARASRAGESPSAREEAFNDIAELMRSVPDSVQKDEEVRLATGLLRLSSHMGERLVDASRFEAAASDSAPAPVAVPVLDHETARERDFLARAVASPELAADILAEVPQAAFAEASHREAFGLLQRGVAPEAWPEPLDQLALALRIEAAGHGDDVPAEVHRAALREAGLRVQLPALERRAAARRAAGDEAGRLEVLALIRRLRQALRGAE